MAHEISCLFRNYADITVTQLTELLDSAECNVDAEYEIYMYDSMFKIEFTRYSDNQDEIILDILKDLSYINIRKYLVSIEMEPLV